MSGPVFESLDCLSQDQFAAWVAGRGAANDERCELLNGRVVMTPPAGYPHGLVGGRLGTALGAFAKAREAGEVFSTSQGFAMPSGDTVEPDLAFIARERWERGPAPADGEFVRIVPDLVVEILSPSTASRDRGEKKAIYERNGVGELWLVDPRARRVTRFVLAAGSYDLGTVFEDGAVLTSLVLDGLALPIVEILGAP